MHIQNYSGDCFDKMIVAMLPRLSKTKEVLPKKHYRLCSKPLKQKAFDVLNFGNGIGCSKLLNYFIK